MIENATQSEAQKMDIVPSPIVVFTKHDANLAARSCPIVEEFDHVNVIIVASSITADQVIARVADLLVTHHAQSKRTKETKVVGSWLVRDIPVKQRAELHQFDLAWPEDHHHA